MSEFPPDIPQWLQITLLVVWAFFFGRWTAHRQNRAAGRHQGRRPAVQPARNAPADPIHNPGAGIDPGLRAPLGLEAELIALLRSGRKIEAIKRAREATGMGLKEAKDFVEGLQ